MLSVHQPFRLNERNWETFATTMDFEVAHELNSNPTEAPNASLAVFFACLHSPAGKPSLDWIDAQARLPLHSCTHLDGISNARTNAFRFGQ